MRHTEPVRSLLLTDHVQPPMLFFIVFYGLDWVATVLPDSTPPERSVESANRGQARPGGGDPLTRPRSAAAAITAWMTTIDVIQRSIPDVSNRRSAGGTR